MKHKILAKNFLLPGLAMVNDWRMSTKKMAYFILQIDNQFPNHMRWLDTDCIQMDRTLQLMKMREETVEEEKFRYGDISLFPVSHCVSSLDLEDICSDVTVSRHSLEMFLLSLVDQTQTIYMVLQL